MPKYVWIILGVVFVGFIILFVMAQRAKAAARKAQEEALKAQQNAMSGNAGSGAFGNLNKTIGNLGGIASGAADIFGTVSDLFKKDEKKWSGSEEEKQQIANEFGSWAYGDEN